MKRNHKHFRITAALLAIAITASVFTGCTGKNDNTETKQPDSQVQESAQIESDGLPTDGEAGSADNALEFKPSDLGVPSQDKYEFPYLGMNLTLTETIRNKMDSKDVILLTGEDYTKDGKLKYAAMYWFTLTEEQKNETAVAFDQDAWLASLGKVGMLGVYNAESVSELDAITGYTNHQELGKSSDGNYTYYLSFADEADAELKAELEKTEVTLTDMLPLDLYMGKTGFSEARVETSNVGDFQTVDMNGNEYTNDLFSEYDLTLVNVFATWCSPCVQEMPALQKIKETMADQDVNVVAVVYDTVSPYGDGEVDQAAIDTAKVLQEKVGLTFPLLMPDSTQMNGRLKGIDSIPESFFVDKNGNIVGETYVGARSYAEWKEIIETELANLKGNN